MTDEEAFRMRDQTGWTVLLREMPVVSSHSHHQVAEQHAKLDLDKLIASSYAGWCGYEPGKTAEERERFVDHVGANTYFVWLAKAVAELYGRGEIHADSWDDISAGIAEAHRRPDHHFELLTKRCRFKFVVQDSYWSPGDDLGRPDLFRPTFRINSWVMCPRPGMADHNGNSPWSAPGFQPQRLDEYLDLLEASVEQAKARGCVAIKSALAYDRPVAFNHPDLEAARRAFQAAGELTRQDLLSFGDVVFHHLCGLAEKLELPFQVHLGLGILHGSRPMMFEPTIAAYPKVTFDLLHCGYPWWNDLGGLLHNYANVVADFCWLPIISTTAAVAALHEYLDVARSADRIVWGDDTWTGEEAYGAVLAWDYVLSRVLEERVGWGLCSTSHAERLAGKLLHENAEKLFGP
jgi:hypothetical protein